jgi:hypothetical protein
MITVGKDVERSGDGGLRRLPVLASTHNLFAAGSEVSPWAKIRCRDGLWNRSQGQAGHGLLGSFPLGLEELDKVFSDPQQSNECAGQTSKFKDGPVQSFPSSKVVKRETSLVAVTASCRSHCDLGMLFSKHFLCFFSWPSGFWLLHLRTRSTLGSTGSAKVLDADSLLWSPTSLLLSWHVSVGQLEY